MAKKINVTYFDNRDIDFEDYKEGYLENRDMWSDEENDTDDVDDNEVWEYIHECIDRDWEDFFGNLNFSKYADMACVIVGSVGAWTGHHTIAPVGCNDVETAIRKCVRNADYITISQNGGHLEVVGAHHDGTNSFEIYLLNDKGVDALDRIENGFGCADLSKKCYHKALHDYLF